MVSSTSYCSLVAAVCIMFGGEGKYLLRVSLLKTITGQDGSLTVCLKLRHVRPNAPSDLELAVCVY